MRVVVLGGTQFIGRAIVEELVARGHELLVVHRGEHEPRDLSRVQHLHAHRQELPQARDELGAFGAAALVDVSALTRVDAEIVLETFPQDLRLVVLSSQDVYRAYAALRAGIVTDQVPLDERSPVRSERYPYRGKLPGLDDYEKLDVEEVCRQRAATICRLAPVYGEYDYQRREEFILRRVRAGRRRIPIGSGSWLWSRCYVRDVAGGVRLALESDAAVGEVFNLCEARTWPIAEWARRILAAAGSDAELVRVRESLLPEDLWLTRTLSQHLLVDSSKARSLLGWTETDPEEAVRRSVQWHLAHPPDDADPDFAADERALAGDAS